MMNGDFVVQNPSAVENNPVLTILDFSHWKRLEIKGAIPIKNLTAFEQAKGSNLQGAICGETRL